MVPSNNIEGILTMSIVFVLPWICLSSQFDSETIIEVCGGGVPLRSSWSIVQSSHWLRHRHYTSVHLSRFAVAEIQTLSLAITFDEMDYNGQAMQVVVQGDVRTDGRTSCRPSMSQQYGSMKSMVDRVSVCSVSMRIRVHCISSRW